MSICCSVITVTYLMIQNKRCLLIINGQNNLKYGAPFLQRWMFSSLKNVSFFKSKMTTNQMTQPSQLKWKLTTEMKKTLKRRYQHVDTVQSAGFSIWSFSLSQAECSAMNKYKNCFPIHTDNRPIVCPWKVSADKPAEIFTPAIFGFKRTCFTGSFLYSNSRKNNWIKEMTLFFRLSGD